MTEALLIVTNEQITNRTFELRRGEELMEIDSVSVRAKGTESRYEELMDHMVGIQKMVKQVLEVQAKGSQKEVEKPKQKHKWTPDGRPICSYCQGIGHTLCRCRKRQHNLAQLGN